MSARSVVSTGSIRHGLPRPCPDAEVVRPSSPRRCSPRSVFSPDAARSKAFFPTAIRTRARSLSAPTRRRLPSPEPIPAEKPIVRPVASVDINCPTVDIAEGGAAYRVGGAESASVRYQFNIGDTARQCDPAGPGQASIKVGVKGDVVIGPAGSAGTYSVPLKVVVTHEGDKKQVYSKTFKVEATTDGVTAGAFRLVTEPILVPMPTLQLADIYTISVGFEGGGAPPRRTATGAIPPVSRACAAPLTKPARSG